MARHLKQGKSADEVALEDAKIREVVEGILDDINSNGDRALRDYSERFDQWSPESFRLSAEDIKACHQQLSEQVIEDIKFAQTQIRNFAQAQKDALRDVEVET